MCWRHTVTVAGLDNGGDLGPSARKLGTKAGRSALRGTHLVPKILIPLTSLSSSSGDQPPFTTSDAIFANHRLRQSLLVLLGTCFAIACHLDGLGLWGSS